MKAAQAAEAAKRWASAENRREPRPTSAKFARARQSRCGRGVSHLEWAEHGT